MMRFVELGLRGGSAAALVVALLLSTPVLSQGDRRAAIEQKLKLLETVLASPRVKQAEAGGDPATRERIEKSRRHYDSARTALQAGDLDSATGALDEALREASMAIARTGAASSAVSAERARNAELAEQLKTYRTSLADARRDPRTAADATAALDKIDHGVAEAEKLSSAGKWAEANSLLGEAYMAAVTAISRMSAGQTVTLSLNFATPADEYAYEIKRHQSHEMLVDMTLQERRAEGDKRKLVDHFVEEAHRLRGRADREAKGGDYAAAIKTLEQATAQLVRALQSLGMPVF